MAAQEIEPRSRTAPTSLQQRMGGRMAESLRLEEERGRRLAFLGRTVALAAVGLLVLLIVPFPGALYYEALIAIFILLGFAAPLLQRAGLYRGWHDYVLIALDFALLAVTLLLPNPIATIEGTPQMALRFGNFVYFFVLLAGLAVSLEPRRVLWGGLMGALAWSAGVVWLVSLPDTIIPETAPQSASELLALFAEPTYVDLDLPVQDVAVFLIVTALLALVVARSRNLIWRQAMLERERGNLARYFPPATVDRLARQDAALAQTREQDAAVLFADLVGFTAWAERHSPQEAIKVLREVHARLEEAVFRHHGTVDKFIGDGMMATFGTPEPAPRDASNALACLIAILIEFEVWNGRRERLGREPLRISVGLHYGPVILGNIGTDRRLEFAVLGDTVNVASRLEALTRELGSRAAISGELATAVMIETDAAGSNPLANFKERGARALKGREETVQVLTYG